jgi:hypothetical protein
MADSGVFRSNLPPTGRTRVHFIEDVPITDAVATAIGHAVVEWGRIEDTAGVLTAVLLGSNYQHFRAVSANMMGRSKLDTLGAVAELRLPPSQAATIKKIVTSIKGLQNERNRLVHSCWYQTNNPQVAQRHGFRAVDSLQHVEENVSAARIKGHTADVIRLCRRLNYALERQGIYRRSPGA